MKLETLVLQQQWHSLEHCGVGEVRVANAKVGINFIVKGRVQVWQSYSEVWLRLRRGLQKTEKFLEKVSGAEFQVMSFSLKLDSRARWLLVYADFLGAAETQHGKIWADDVTETPEAPDYHHDSKDNQQEICCITSHPGQPIEFISLWSADKLNWFSCLLHQAVGQ